MCYFVIERLKFFAKICSARAITSTRRYYSNNTKKSVYWWRIVFLLLVYYEYTNLLKGKIRLSCYDNNNNSSDRQMAYWHAKLLVINDRFNEPTCNQYKSIHWLFNKYEIGLYRVTSIISVRRNLLSCT